MVALASKNGFLYVFDRVTGKPLWPIEERAVPKSTVPGEITSPTQPFPTVIPPFSRQTMTVKDMYDGFMTDEQKVWWTDRLTKARSGFYTPPTLGQDTIQMPSVNGGALFFGTAAEPASGVVYVMSRDMPSIVKLVPAGESTIGNNGGLIPDRPRAAGRGPALATPPQRGRTVYDQNCQSCHGPELKGDRGPAIDSAVSSLGADAVGTIVGKGKGAMPPFAQLPAALVSDLLEFLRQPAAVPPGSGAPAAAVAVAAGRTEPGYPADVPPPPSRYKTGYGNEQYVITPPWSQITAYDLNTGKIKWQTPYGDLPQAGPSDKLRGNVFPKSGIVVTAGGLVLFAGNDSKLYALNKETGNVIFTKDLPNGSLGVPAVYEVAGREYVLLAVSGGNPFPVGGRLAPGGKNPPAISKSYIAFALPKGN